MPYRRAHWWLLALLPAIVVAFWPNYFGRLRNAELALHAHGLTASCWVILTWLQSWSAATRRFALHRASGLATFVIVPAFVAAGALAVIDMSRRFVAQADPFNGTFGARLALEDMIAVVVFAVLTTMAIAKRRDLRFHAGAMLATILLVLSPILGRLLQHVPFFPAGFAPALHVSDLFAAVVALELARRDRRAALPFVIAAIANLAQSLLFETVARTAAWEDATRRIAAVDALPVVLGAAAVGAGLMWWAWVRGPARRSAAAGTPAAA